MSFQNGAYADQLLGESSLAHIMDFLDKIEYFLIATLDRQNSAASFTAWIQPPEAFNQHFAPPKDDETENASDADIKSKKLKRETFRDRYIEDFKEIRPNTFRFLRRGAETKFSNPPDVVPVKDFLQPILQIIARDSGLSYEAVSGDFANSSYSAARMAENQTRMWIRHRQNILESRVLNKIGEWMTQGLKLEGLNMTNVWLRWQFPAPMSSNPKEESENNKLLYESGIKSQMQWIRETNQDPDVVFAEIAREALIKIALAKSLKPESESSEKSLSLPQDQSMGGH